MDQNQVADSESEFAPGTVGRRYEYLTNELDRLFPYAVNPVLSDPPEPKYIACIEGLIEQKRQLELLYTRYSQAVWAIARMLPDFDEFSYSQADMPRKLVEAMDRKLADPDLEVGAIVKHYDESGLRCGSGVYPYAIVVSMEPFVLVSESSDMRWGGIPRAALTVIGKATDKQLEVCKRRL